MKKPVDARDLAIDIYSRSHCAVRVGAAIEDNYGIYSWGWNSEGPSGFGQCAEKHAIARANKARLLGSTIYVAGQRRRNSKAVTSKPCGSCQKLIDKWELNVYWRNHDGRWVHAGTAL